MQKRYTTFRAPVESFPLGEQKIGLLKPGRYNGFDILSLQSALNVRLGHTGKVRKTNKAGFPINLFGAIMMPTGIIIHEDEPIDLTIESNAGNGNDRVDYVICEHNYQELAYGVPATYSIIKGPNSGAEPTLTNPAKQILLGKIYIEAYSFDFKGVTYVPEITPLPGDLTYSQLINILNTNMAIESASETVEGIARLATQQEVHLGEDALKIVTPATLAGRTATEERTGLVEKATDIEAQTGQDDTRYITPKQLNDKVKNNQVITKTSNYTLQTSDAGELIRVIWDNSSVLNITVPTGLPEGFSVAIFQDHPANNSNTGVTQFPGYSSNGYVGITANGAKVRTAMGDKLKGPGSMCYLQHTGQNNFVLMGDLKF